MDGIAQKAAFETRRCAFTRSNGGIALVWRMREKRVQDQVVGFDLDAVNTGSSVPVPTWIVAVVIGICVVGLPVILYLRSRGRR